MIRNRVAMLMYAEMALTTALSHVQRADVGGDLVERLLALKRDVLAERTRIDAEAAAKIPA